MITMENSIPHQKYLEANPLKKYNTKVLTLIRKGEKFFPDLQIKTEMNVS